MLFAQTRKKKAKVFATLEYNDSTLKKAKNVFLEVNGWVSVLILSMRRTDYCRKIEITQYTAVHRKVPGRYQLSAGRAIVVIKKSMSLRGWDNLIQLTVKLFSVHCAFRVIPARCPPGILYLYLVLPV